MEKINIKAKSAVARTVEVLKAGGVVMHPTETCYGLAVDIFNEKALKKLYKIKGRDFNKPVSIFVDGIGMAYDYGIFSDKAFKLASRHWPGPLSIVVPRKRMLPDFLNRGKKFISFRLSNNKFCQKVLKEFKKPITTTSANIKDKPPLYEVDLSAFGKNAKYIDLVIDGGELTKNKPSTVVKVFDDNVEILRQGDVVIDSI